MYSGRDHITLADVVGPERRGALAPGEADVTLIDRQALHAHRLRFRHPLTGNELDLTAPPPEDMERTLQALRTHRGT
jgi:23S rRNA pseudouridine1911/1915/1917 synthase